MPLIRELADALYCHAMKRYLVPPNSNQKLFRTFAYSCIGLMLIFLAISRTEWQGLNDRASHALGWGAVGLLILFMGGVFFLIVKNSVQSVWQREAFDLADQKIVRLSEGKPSIELALTEIQFLGESRMGLFVQGGNPLKAIVIPRAIRVFEELKRQLSAYCKVTPVKNRTSLLAVLPLTVAIVLYAFLLLSRSGVVVLSAGVGALLFHALWLFSIREILARTSSPKAVIFAFLVSWLLLAWIVYQRMSSTFHFIHR